MRKKIAMRLALSQSELLGNILAGPSWFAWRCLLIAIVGEPLETDEERAAFKLLTGGREAEPGEMVELAMIIAGRRSGKTRASAVLAIYLATLCDWSEHIAVGEEPRCLFLSPTTWQAQIALKYAVGIIDSVPLLAELVVGRTQDSLTLANGITLEVAVASPRHVRGTTAVCIVADEVAFMPSSEDAAARDVEVILAARPSLATTGGPLMMTSSPSIPDGLVYDLHKKHFGPQGHPRLLVVQTGTKGLNPTIADSVIQRAREDNPDAAAAEWDADFRQPVAGYLDRAVIERAVAWGETERGPVPGAVYRAFCDAAGGGGWDSFVLAIGHVFSAEGRKIAALDYLAETRPPFDADVVCGRYAEVLRRYGLTAVVGDKFGGDLLVSFFRRHGISYQASSATRSELYLYCAPRFLSGQISLLSQPRLVDQFAGLRRRVLSGGREEVDHPRGHHDDCANGAAGLVYLLLPPEYQGPLYAPMVVWSSGRVEGGQRIGEAPPEAALDPEERRRQRVAELRRQNGDVLPFSPALPRDAGGWADRLTYDVGKGPFSNVGFLP
jgi:hypothetical protein